VNSYEEAHRLDKEYYLSMSPKRRLEIVQTLREEYYKIKKDKKKRENRKRLRRVIRVIKQT
jgi:hypothetical protein